MRVLQIIPWLLWIACCVSIFGIPSEGSETTEASVNVTTLAIDSGEVDTTTTTIQPDSRENEISDEITEENVETSTLPSLSTVTEDLEISPDPVPTPVPDQTLTSTVPPRILTPEEMEAKAILNETNAKLESSKLNLFKVKPELIIRLLDSMLPDLEKVQQNMTALLSEPIQSQTLAEYIAKEDELENKIIAVENRLEENRLQGIEYEAALEAANSKFRNLQNTLASILAAQFPNTTDIKDILGIVDPTPQEIISFLNEALHRGANQSESQSQSQGRKEKREIKSRAQEIAEFITNLHLPENRNGSYVYVMRELYKNYLLLSTAERKSLMFYMVKDVYQFPEFKPFQDSLPKSIQLLFSNDLRTIRTSQKGRAYGNPYYLEIDENNVLRTVPKNPEVGSDVHKNWRLLPIEDGRYYLIVHVPKRLILGMSSDFRTVQIKQFQGDIDNLQSITRDDFLDSNLSDGSDMGYQWDVRIAPGDPMQFKFVNRGGKGLVWESGTEGPNGSVSFQSASLSSWNQATVATPTATGMQWEIE